MLIGNNTLRYWEDKTLQRWENADNQFIYPYFGTNKIPAFVLISDTAEEVAEVSIHDARTDDIFSTAKTVTVSTNGTKKMLYFAGITLTGGSDGCYYLKITTGLSATETYYSEVFAWTEDSTSNLKELGLLKISAISAATNLANTYDITLTGITYECFIEVQEPEIDQDIKESGDEKPYGEIGNFNTLAFKHKYELLGDDSIFRFLCFLRILNTNGTVTFTYNGIADIGYDIICEKEDSTEDTISMSLEYKEVDYVSSSNEI